MMISIGFVIFSVVACGVLGESAATMKNTQNGPPAPGAPCKDCPNIIVMITDDQDEILGGWDIPMTQTQSTFEKFGMKSSQWRIHTPICAPSRAEIFSGSYFRNIWSNETTPSPAVSSGAVMQVDLAKTWQQHFAITLRSQAGYTTGLFGKCMNGDCGPNAAAGKSDLHLLGAFDQWFEHAGYVNGSFFNNTGCPWPWDSKKCRTATHPGGIWAGRGDGYDTSTVGNVSIEWIRSVAHKDRPFFAYIAPHAPHSPATPPTWYETGTVCDSVKSPRTPDYNYSGTPTTSKSSEPPSGGPPLPKQSVYWWNNTEFHELVSSQPPLDQDDADTIDALARDRCRTLLAVDDVWVGVYRTLQELGIENNTYVIITSDHGYNLGQHRLPSNVRALFFFKIYFLGGGVL